MQDECQHRAAPPMLEMSPGTSPAGFRVSAARRVTSAAELHGLCSVRRPRRAVFDRLRERRYDLVVSETFQPRSFEEGVYRVVTGSAPSASSETSA